MDWKQDRKYVLEKLDRQEESNKEIAESIADLKDCVTDKVHTIDIRTKVLESRVKTLLGGVATMLVVAFTWVQQKLFGE